MDAHLCSKLTTASSHVLPVTRPACVRSFLGGHSALHARARNHALLRRPLRPRDRGWTCLVLAADATSTYARAATGRQMFESIRSVVSFRQLLQAACGIARQLSPKPRGRRTQV